MFTQETAEPEMHQPQNEGRQEAPAASVSNISKQTTAGNSSALQTFLKTYNTFISENQNVCIDLDKVMIDLNSQIRVLPPPSNCPSRYEQLWKKGQTLDKGSVQQTAGKLKKINDVKLYETIVNIEKLHAKLNAEYNTEINRSVELGLIHKQP